MSLAGPVLAIDTSGPVGSVALGADGAVLAKAVLERQREHAASLVPAVADVLERAGTRAADLGGVVVGEGPGSFTGVRVAAATVKGMCHALGRPLWAASSLLAAALAEETGPVRYALFDARGDRVYGACYAIDDSRASERVPPHGGTVRDVLAGAVPEGAVFVGDGSRKHRDAIESAGFVVAEEPEATLAEGLLAWWFASPGAARVDDVATWEPLYVRASSAERLWSA